MLLHDATALSAVYFQPYFIPQFFPLKCGFYKPDKTIIMENNVVSQWGCKLVKPECKLSLTNTADMWAITLNNLIN